MATISSSAKILTLVNVFTVDPAKQQKLVEVLIEATEQTMKRMPGFISASIHKSYDGAKSSITPNGKAARTSRR